MTAPQPGLLARLGPVGIAAVAAGVLILFGVGAVVVPALTEGSASPTNRTGPTNPVSQPTTETSSSAPGVVPSTAPATTGAPTLIAANFNSGYEDRVVQLVNNERRKGRCEPVRMNGQLRNAARMHSADMAARDFNDSVGSDGSTPADRAAQAGYGALAGELTAKGGDAGDVVKRWLHDDNKREVLVDCAVRSIGVGAAMRGRTAYWTVDTGRA
jgi:uncharacterized protein YkwD